LNGFSSIAFREQVVCFKYDNLLILTRKQYINNDNHQKVLLFSYISLSFINMYLLWNVLWCTVKLNIDYTGVVHLWWLAATENLFCWVYNIRRIKQQPDNGQNRPQSFHILAKTSRTVITLRTFAVLIVGDAAQGDIINHHEDALSSKRKHRIRNFTDDVIYKTADTVSLRKLRWRFSELISHKSVVWKCGYSRQSEKHRDCTTIIYTGIFLVKL